jgi:hypothetical protein
LKAWQRLNIETWLWLIFAAYWFLGALRTCKTRKREGLLSSLPRNAVLALGGVLLFGKWFSRSLLARPALHLGRRGPAYDRRVSTGVLGALPPGPLLERADHA